jgi:energy-coupling factor transport system permease protein
MQDFALLRHVSIGQYLPGDSVVHRLDPRVKITLVMLLIVALMFNTSYLGNAIVLLLCAGLVLLAGVSFGYILGSVRPVAPVLAMLAVFQLFFLGGAPVTTTIPTRTFFEWGPLALSTNSIQVAVVSLLRFVDLTILISLLTNTTPLAHLTYAIEDMLRPFAPLGLPAHEIALVGMITLRFIPILAEQMETIVKAQASRGAQVAAGGRLAFIQNARSILVFIVPLFLDAFRRAEDLIVAMEARCYTGGRGRTRLLQLHITPADACALILAAGVSGLLIAFGRRFPF